MPTSTRTSVDQRALLVRAQDGARLLGISARKLWELTHRGQIPCVRIGRALRYSVRALEAWVAEQSNPKKSLDPESGSIVSQDGTS